MSNVTVLPWKIEFDRRIEAFASAIGLPVPKVLEVFSSMGIDGAGEESLTAIDDEQYTPFGDLRAAFVDGDLAKLVRLRLAIPHLRGRTETTDVKPTANGDLTSAINAMVASNRPKSDWNDEELLKQLDESATEITEILSKRTKGRPCIVFDASGGVNVGMSLPLVKLARSNKPTADKHKIGDKIVRVYRVGQWLPSLLDASPFFPDTALVENYCAKSDTEWAGVDHTRRVLASIYATKCERGVLSNREMRTICNDAHCGVDYFRREYPQAALIYDELEAQDRLPKLKIVPSNGARQDLPFKKDGE